MEIGTEDSNNRISDTDLLKFWRQEYVPRNSALLISGDLTAKEVRSLANKYFGSWTGNVGEHQRIREADKVHNAIFIINKPDSPQTQIRVATPGVSRSTPDYAALEIMNTVFGGLFSSRINMNLREEHGYTYGVSSNFVFRRDGGYFSSGGDVRADVTAPAVRELMGEIDRIRRSPISDSELALAKHAFVLRLPAFFETSARTIDTLEDLFVYDLPLNYYRTLPAQVEEISIADVRRVADEHLKPESMIIVAVGDSRKIEKPLEDLKLGPLQLLH